MYPELHRDPVQLTPVKTCLDLSSCSWPLHDYAVSCPNASLRSLLFLNQFIHCTTAKSHICVGHCHSLLRTFQWLVWHLEQHSSSLLDLLGLKWLCLVISYVCCNWTLSQAHHPPGTWSSFCFSNTPTPFPAWGLYRWAHPHVWKVPFHIFSLSSCSSNVLLGQRLFWILPSSQESVPRTCQLYQCHPLYRLGDTITVCDDLVHWFACSLICYLCPQRECKYCEVEPLSALLTREALSPLDSARR